MGACLILLRAIITKTPLQPPTPRISKYVGGIINISAWIYKQQQKTPEENIKYYNQVFDQYEYDTNDVYVSTLREFRNKKMFWGDKEEKDCDKDQHQHEHEIVEEKIDPQDQIVEFKFKFVE